MLRWSVTLTTAPAAEPVTTAEAKAHLNLTISDDDTYVGTLISVARKWCEQYTRRSFVTQTRKLWLERFPSYSDCYGPYYRGSILLPYGPLTGLVSSSIAYDDTNGDEQTLTGTWRQTTGDDPPRIEPAYGQVWPSTRDQSEAVRVTYSAGYGGASSVPEPIKQAILVMVAGMYENREEEISGTIIAKFEFNVKALLAPYVSGWEW